MTLRDQIDGKRSELRAALRDLDDMEAYAIRLGLLAPRTPSVVPRPVFTAHGFEEPAPEDDPEYERIGERPTELMDMVIDEDDGET